MDSARGALPVSLADLPNSAVSLEMTSEPLAQPVHLVGSAVVHVDATLQHAQNAFVAANLYETKGEERRLISWGMFNVAHREGHDQYVPVTPGERFTFGVPLLPTEYVFEAGAVLTLELHGAGIMEWSLTPPTEPGALDVYAEGSILELPTVEGGDALPATAQR